MNREPPSTERALPLQNLKCALLSPCSMLCLTLLGHAMQVLLPALDVGVGYLHSAPDTPDAAVEESQSTSSRVWQQQGPDFVLVTSAKLSASRDAMVAVTIADVSLQLDCTQLHTVEHFAYCASVGPMLPVTLGYPPVTAPHRKQLTITLSARTVVGAVRLADCGAGCSFAMQQASVNYTSHTFWVRCRGLLGKNMAAW